MAGNDRQRIGEMLRLRRKMRGMSLKEVCSISGISVGMLSQVERGLTAPSIKTMRAICDALEMPVKWLFEVMEEEEDEDAGYIVRKKSRREILYQDGAILKQILSPDTVPKIQMLRFVLQPGANSGEPYSNSEGGKCGIVVSGRLELSIDGHEMSVFEGDSFSFPATSLVSYWNEGAIPCDVLWIVAPATI